MMSLPTSSGRMKLEAKTLKNDVTEWKEVDRESCDCVIWAKLLHLYETGKNR